MLTMQNKVRQWLLAHPYWPLFVISIGAWLWYLVAASHIGGHHGHHHHGHHDTLPVTTILANWLIMVFAMMLPMASSAIRFIRNSLPRYQVVRSSLLFFIAYCLTWTVTGAITLLVFSPIGLPLQIDGLPVAAIAYIIAGTWCFSRHRRAAAQACGAGVPLRINGWPCYWDSFKFGLLKGQRCVVSCYVIMLAMLVAAHDLLIMLVLTCALLYERMILPRTTKLLPATCFAITLYYLLTWPGLAVFSS